MAKARSARFHSPICPYINKSSQNESSDCQNKFNQDNDFFNMTTESLSVKRWCEKTGTDNVNSYSAWEPELLMSLNDLMDELTFTLLTETNLYARINKCCRLLGRYKGKVPPPPETSGPKYLRVLIGEVEDVFQMLILIWSPGASSALHNHPCEKCFLMPLQGDMSEIRYEVKPTNEGEDICTFTVISKTKLECGVPYWIDDDIGWHKVVAKGEEVCATLHVYIPKLNSCCCLDKKSGRVINFLCTPTARETILKDRKQLEERMLKLAFTNRKTNTEANQLPTLRHKTKIVSCGGFKANVGNDNSPSLSGDETSNEIDNDGVNTTCTTDEIVGLGRVPDVNAARLNKIGSCTTNEEGKTSRRLTSLFAVINDLASSRTLSDKESTLCSKLAWAPESLAVAADAFTYRVGAGLGYSSKRGSLQLILFAYDLLRHLAGFLGWRRNIYLTGSLGVEKSGHVHYENSVCLSSGCEVPTNDTSTKRTNIRDLAGQLADYEDEVCLKCLKLMSNENATTEKIETDKGVSCGKNNNNLCLCGDLCGCADTYCLKCAMARLIMQKTRDKFGGVFLSSVNAVYIAVINVARWALLRRKYCDEDNAISTEDSAETAFEGVKHQNYLTLYVTEGLYESYKYAAKLCGLGSENVKMVLCDSNYSMCVDDIRKMFLLARKENGGIRPKWALVCHAANPITGCFDNFNKISKVCQEFGVWMHIEGNFEASYLVSPAYQFRHLTAGMSLADSFSWPLQELLGLPRFCTALLVKEKSNEPILFQTENKVKNEGLGCINSINEKPCTGDLNYCILNNKFEDFTDIIYDLIPVDETAVTSAFAAWIQWKNIGDLGIINRVHLLHSRTKEVNSFLMFHPKTTSGIPKWPFLGKGWKYQNIDEEKMDVEPNNDKQFHANTGMSLPQEISVQMTDSFNTNGSYRSGFKVQMIGSLSTSAESISSDEKNTASFDIQTPTTLLNDSKRNNFEQISEPMSHREEVNLDIIGSSSFFVTYPSMGCICTFFWIPEFLRKRIQIEGIYNYADWLWNSSFKFRKELLQNIPTADFILTLHGTSKWSQIARSVLRNSKDTSEVNANHSHSKILPIWQIRLVNHRINLSSVDELLEAFDKIGNTMFTENDFADSAFIITANEA